MQNLGFTVGVPNGSRTMITSPNSGVKLQVPEEAVQEVLLGRVYDKSSRFQHLIPQDEYPVLRIVEYSQRSILEMPSVSGYQYKIQIPIPYNLTDIKDVHDRLKIRYGNIHGKSTDLIRASKHNVKETCNVSYSFSKNCITINTAFLTGFIVTLSDPTWCHYLQAFGKITETSDGQPFAKVKTYLCRSPYSIKPQEQVSVFNYATYSWNIKICLIYVLSQLSTLDRT